MEFPQKILDLHAVNPNFHVVVGHFQEEGIVGRGAGEGDDPGDGLRHDLLHGSVLRLGYSKPRFCGIGEDGYNL